MSTIASGVSAASADQRTPNAYETLTSGDFLRIMFAELSRQDPTKPTDSKDLLDQLGSIRSIESDTTLTKRLEEFSKQNEITSAGSLVGTFVEGRTSLGEETRGFVDSISVTREGIVLNLSSGKSIGLDDLSRVYDPALIQPTPSPAGEEDEPVAEAPESEEESAPDDDETPETPARGVA